MNYHYLLKKYSGLDAIVHDRSYDGLVVIGGPKPTMETFNAWQEEEDRLARQENRRVEERHSELELRTERARAKALEEIRPFEDKLKEMELEVLANTTKLRMGALECQAAIRGKTEVELAWGEITKAQDLLNQESQKYLDDTAFVLSWDRADVPVDIALRRREALERIKSGRVVYADWNSLRSNEMPSRAELEEAVRKGGAHLERIRETIKGVHLRYPKPRVEQSHNLPPLKKRH